MTTWTVAQKNIPFPRKLKGVIVLVLWLVIFAGGIQTAGKSARTVANHID